MWLEFIKLSFDLLKEISWPLVVFMLFIRFTPDFRKLFPRIVKFRSDLFGFDLAPPSPQTIPKDESFLNIDQGGTKNSQSNKADQIIHNEILKKLDKPQAEEEINILLKKLVHTSKELAYERIYRVIYGSQIKFLQHLNTLTCLTEIGAFAFFSKYERFFTNPDFGFNEWLEFLEGTQLINIRDYKISISEDGQTFLNYMINWKLPLEKPW